MGSLKVVLIFIFGTEIGNLSFWSSAAENVSSEQGHDPYEVPLVLGWIEKPPYAVSPTNESLDNAVHGLIRDAVVRYILKECEYSSGLEYQAFTRKFESEFELLQQLRQDIVHIALPIFEDANNRKYSEFIFFKLDDYPGTEFITTEDDTTTLTVVMDSVLKSWPLLAVTLVLTAIAGIIMWALVSGCVYREADT